MVNRICWVYSEQELTPRAIEVIKKIKDENGYGDVKFVGKLFGKPSHEPVLVFGKVTKPELLGSSPLIHTYSIAQIMSKANAVTVLNASLQMYFNGVHVPKGVFPVWNNLILPEFWDFDKPTAIDIETSGNLGETHTPEEVELLSVALYQEGRNPLVILNPKGGREGTLPLSPAQLESLREQLPKFTKAIYHNGKFDTRVLNRILGIKLCVWADTMLMHHTLNHAAGAHGLKELAKRYLGAEEWEANLGKYTKGGGHYELIPFLELLKYNAWDVYWTYQLWKLFTPQIEADEDHMITYEFELAAADMLLDVEMNGIPFSEANAEILTLENHLKMDEELAKLRAVAGERFNPNSPKQVKETLYHEFGFSVGSTNEEALTKIIEDYADDKVAEWCEALLEFRGLAKQNSTYSKGWLKQARKLDGDEQLRVRPTFFVHGTSTGRLSSSKPNAQNMPRDKKVRAIVKIEE